MSTQELEVIWNSSVWWEQSCPQSTWSTILSHLNVIYTVCDIDHILSAWHSIVLKYSIGFDSWHLRMQGRRGEWPCLYPGAQRLHLCPVTPSLQRHWPVDWLHHRPTAPRGWHWHAGVMKRKREKERDKKINENKTSTCILIPLVWPTFCSMLFFHIF